jgi:hypothetical protein
MTDPERLACQRFRLEDLFGHDDAEGGVELGGQAGQERGLA